MTRLVLAIILAIISQVNCQCDGGSGTRYFPHPSQCDRYYVCENGQLVDERLCPDGLVFNDQGNPNKLRCDLPFGIDCSTRPDLQPPQSMPRCPRANGMFPDLEDCGKFIICNNGIPIFQDCPPSLVYNKAIGACDFPDNTPECRAEDLLGFSCPQATLREIMLFGHPRYASPYDCRNFYVCLTPPDDPSGPRAPRLLGCEQGKAFNPQTGVCDDARDVPGCENYYSNTIDRQDSGFYA